MDYAKKVFVAESGEEGATYEGRDELASELGIGATQRDKPLLHAILEQFSSGGGDGGGGGGGSGSGSGSGGGGGGGGGSGDSATAPCFMSYSPIDLWAHTPDSSTEGAMEAAMARASQFRLAAERAEQCLVGWCKLKPVLTAPGFRA